LKRSKSFRFLLLVVCSRFLANSLLLNLLSISWASHCFLRATVPAPRGSFSRTKRVSETVERGAEWRGTESSTVEAGPSTRTCRVHVNLQFFHSSNAPGSSVPPGGPPWCAHTRLWSMISAIAARRPAKGPETKSTTLPTSTSLH
jgi:hypothetical protein